MKEDGKFSKIIIWIVVFPLTILMALFLIIYTPIDYIRYCFSHRRKEMKRLYEKRAKYSWLVTLTSHYRLYELITKQNLPIRFFPRSENPCINGFFYCNGILFLEDIVPHYDHENNNWYISQKDCAEDLTDYMELEKEEFHKCMGYNENLTCERVVFLVNEKDFSREEKDMAESAEFILTYNKKNFAEKINEFFST